MTKKSPILAVNEPVKKQPASVLRPEKRQAVRRPLPEERRAGIPKGRKPSVAGRCPRGVTICCSVSLEPVLSSVFTISLFVRTPTAGNPAMA